MPADASGSLSGLPLPGGEAEEENTGRCGLSVGPHRPSGSLIENAPAPSLGDEAGASVRRRSARGRDHWKVISYPSVKFDVAEPPTASRCQAWKLQVSPVTTATKPVGWGTWVLSMAREIEPPAPEF